MNTERGGVPTNSPEPPVTLFRFSSALHSLIHLHQTCPYVKRIVWTFFLRHPETQLMAKSKLSKREIEICERIRFAREQVVEMTQAACAREIGIDRSTLANYEVARTPLRYDLALRFCRQFIISEEWLATGRFDMYRAVAESRGWGSGANQSHWDDFDRKISIRQCVDLLSDPATLHVKPRSLFSVAFDTILKERYGQLVETSFLLPRIVMSEADKPELAINFLKAIHERHFYLLLNMRLQMGTQSNSSWHLYTRYLFQCASFIFRKLLGAPKPREFLVKLEPLSEPLAAPDAVVGPLSASGHMDQEWASPPEYRFPAAAAGFQGEPTLGKAMLDTSDSSFHSGGVQDDVRDLDWLINRLKKVTAPRGAKAALAREFKVTRQAVDQWLSGESKPSADIALRLRDWVENPKRQQKQTPAR